MLHNLLNISSDSDVFHIRERCLNKLRPSQLERLNTVAGRVPALLNGTFFLRSTSQNGIDFTFPGTEDPLAEHVIAWSHILEKHEVLCAVNLHKQHYAIVYVTIDDKLHRVDGVMSCLYASEMSPAELNIEVRNGKAIRLTIPPHAMVIYG